MAIARTMGKSASEQSRINTELSVRDSENLTTLDLHQYEIEAWVGRQKETRQSIIGSSLVWDAEDEYGEWDTQYWADEDWERSTTLIHVNNSHNLFYEDFLTTRFTHSNSTGSVDLVGGHYYLDYNDVYETDIIARNNDYLDGLTAWYPLTGSLENKSITINNSILYDGLELWLKFENNLTDSSINNITVTNSGGDYNDGPYIGGYSRYFDGTNDYLTVTDDVNITFDETDSFSISYWLWGPSLVDNTARTMFIKGTGLHIYSQNGLGSGHFNITAEFSDGTPVVAEVTSGVNLAKWNHIVVLNDAVGSNLKIYVNNSLAATESTSSLSGISTTGNMTIGGASNDFNSYMADIRIYSKAIDTTIIDNLYNSRRGIAGDAIWDDGHIADKAAYFDGATYIDTNNIPLYSGSECTIACWAKVDTTTTTDQRLVFRPFGNNTGARSGTIGANTTGSYYFYIKNTNGDEYNLYIPQVAGTWQHLVGTFKRNGSVEFYNNGSLADSDVAGDYNSETGSTHNMYIGALDSTQQFFTGYIEDVRIYEKQLIGSQIGSIYNAGNGINSNFVRKNYSSVRLDVNSDDLSTGSLLLGSNYDAWYKCLAVNDNMTVTDFGGSGHTGSMKSFAYSYWPLHNGTGSDYGQVGSHAVRLNTNMDFVENADRFGTAGAIVTGSQTTNESFLVQSSNGNYEHEQFTAIVWIKQDNWNSTNQSFLSHYNWEMRYDSATGSLQCFIRDTGSTFYIVYGPPTEIGSWYQMAFVVDCQSVSGNGTIKLYINGELKDTESIGSVVIGATYGDPTADLQWGMSAHGTASPFIGSIGETWYFNRTLDADEISGHYDYSKLYPSYNPIAIKNNRTGLIFDGMSTYIDIGNHNNKDNGDSLTYTGWFNTSRLSDFHLGSSYATIFGASFSNEEDIYVDINGKLRVGFDDTHLTSDDNVVKTNTWQHFAVVWDYNSEHPSDSRYELYLNGSLIESIGNDSDYKSRWYTWPVEGWTTNSNRYIAREDRYDHMFPGIISNIKMFDRALTPYEVRKVFLGDTLDNNYITAQMISGNNTYNLNINDITTGSFDIQDGFKLKLTGAGNSSKLNSFTFKYTE